MHVGFNDYYGRNLLHYVITADKSLKLRKYKLDNDDWVILKDLLRVLKVCYSDY